jgi:hypothetical protein
MNSLLIGKRYVTCQLTLLTLQTLLGLQNHDHPYPSNPVFLSAI